MPDATSALPAFRPTGGQFRIIWAYWPSYWAMERARASTTRTQSQRAPRCGLPFGWRGASTNSVTNSARAHVQASGSEEKSYYAARSTRLSGLVLRGSKERRRLHCAGCDNKHRSKWMTNQRDCSRIIAEIHHLRENKKSERKHVPLRILRRASGYE